MVEHQALGKTLLRGMVFGLVISDEQVAMGLIPLPSM